MSGFLGDAVLSNGKAIGIVIEHCNDRAGGASLDSMVP